MGILVIYKTVSSHRILFEGTVLKIPDFPSTGRYRILCLTSSDLLDPNGVSAQTLAALGSLIPQFPKSVLEQIVIHPRLSRDFIWHDIPAAVKQYSEMSFYSGYQMDDVYGIYGVSPGEGVLAIVRPDGYIGIVASLGDGQRVRAYLESLLCTV